jgi:hypothetical protein
MDVCLLLVFYIVNYTLILAKRISRSTDGKENVEMVWTRSKDGFGKKTKIGTGGNTRRRKRKRQT